MLAADIGPSMIAGAAGLLGVCVGGLVTWSIEERKSDRLLKEERANRQRVAAELLQDLIESTVSQVILMQDLLVTKRLDQHNVIVREAAWKLATDANHGMVLATRLLDDELRTEVLYVLREAQSAAPADFFLGRTEEAGNAWLTYLRVAEAAAYDSLGKVIRD